MTSDFFSSSCYPIQVRKTRRCLRLRNLTLEQYRCLEVIVTKGQSGFPKCPSCVKLSTVDEPNMYAIHSKHTWTPQKHWCSCPINDDSLHPLRVHRDVNNVYSCLFQWTYLENNPFHSGDNRKHTPVHKCQNDNTIVQRQEEFSCYIPLPLSVILLHFEISKVDKIIKMSI